MSVWLSTAFYLSAAVFLGGMLWRLWMWLRAPVPLNIVLTPAPTTNAGVAQRLASELILFRSLSAADPRLWITAWLFHLSLLLLAIGHFGGLVVPGLVCSFLGLNDIQFRELARVTGGVVGLLALAPLLYLLLRRFANQRLRYFSTLGDYIALGLLLLVIITGNEMRFLGGLEVAEARQFVSGLLSFHPSPTPADPRFTIHLLLVCALLIYFPFSKLVHLGAAMFNPTLNQRNDARERRHA